MKLYNIILEYMTREKLKKHGLFILLIAIWFGCKDIPKQDNDSKIQHIDLVKQLKFRPRFHFTPKANWMNDPNGLVYYKDKYHLFYQYYPDSTVWGPMHWGHAKSKDLLYWEHMPIALYPDSLGYIFSGSAVIDRNNTAGFGKDAMIAIFTYHDPIKEKEGSVLFQTQGLAYSNDEGATWLKYQDNPIIENPGIRDFRDPKVFWNEDRLMWQMLLVAKDHVQIYESSNLKKWIKISEFHFDDTENLGVWECPDLFKLKVEDSTEEKWVLIVSHGDGAPNGGSGTRYFVGDYDGITFTTNQKSSQWIDYGTDNYAGVTYNNTPDNKRIFIGWMSNWNYAISTPTETWRSAMTLPRELTLLKEKDIYYVKSNLIDGFRGLYTEIPENEIKGNFPFKFEYANLQQSVISFDAELENSLSISLSNNNKESFKINYNKEKGLITTDRSQSGKVDFNEKYANMSIQTMDIGKMEHLSFKLVLDASSIEIFINNGQFVMTNQIFPNENFTLFEINSTIREKINNFKIKYINTTIQQF
jgi:fructan beta-fructosidase